MPAAEDVAAYLTYLAQTGEEEDPLTHLRLQKLLYYVQAWSLTLRDTAMFPEKIEAWAHGPVVKSMYYVLKGFGSNPFTLTKSSENFNMSDDERSFIAEVWEEYKPFAALKLREMTHHEDPWINARKGFGPADLCSVEITQQAMKDYFSRIAKG